MRNRYDVFFPAPLLAQEYFLAEKRFRRIDIAGPKAHSSAVSYFYFLCERVNCFYTLPLCIAFSSFFFVSCTCIDIVGSLRSIMASPSEPSSEARDDATQKDTKATTGEPNRSICGVCNDAPSKYKCPRCYLP